MRTILPVFAILGVIVMVFAATMLVPLGVAWYGDERALWAYKIGIATTFCSGALMWLVSRRYRRELQPRDGVMLVSTVWTLLPLFASLPLWLYFRQMGQPMSFTEFGETSRNGNIRERSAAKPRDTTTRRVGADAQ